MVHIHGVKYNILYHKYSTLFYPKMDILDNPKLSKIIQNYPKYIIIIKGIYL